MARPPLPIGTWGEIRYEVLPDGQYRARCRYRDFDGKTRQAGRAGKTKGAARSALTSALAERMTPSGDEITGDTRINMLATIWMAEIEGGDLAINTVKRYRESLENQVIPALGSLQIREASVTRLDRFLKATSAGTGAPTAKVCKTILSGMMGLAVRHGALPTNPVRDVAGVTVVKKEPRALTVDEIRAAREAVRQWQSGVRPEGVAKRGRPPTQDLLPLLDLLLATGARINELLAVRWSEVDLIEGTVLITGTLVKTEEKPARIIRQEKPKSESSRRELALPRFAVDTLMRLHMNVVAANVHDVVFPSVNGTLRDDGAVRKQIDKILAPIGMGWVTPSTYRRTVATVLERAEDIQVAADQLGHAGTDVTRRHYVEATHVGPDARALLDSLMDSSR